MELTLGSLLNAPSDGISGPLVMPPSVPGLEGLVGPMQQLAMHFLSNVAKPQHKQGNAAHAHKLFLYSSIANTVIMLCVSLLRGQSCPRR